MLISNVGLIFFGRPPTHRTPLSRPRGTRTARRRGVGVPQQGAQRAFLVSVAVPSRVPVHHSTRIARSSRRRHNPRRDLHGIDVERAHRIASGWVPVTALAGAGGHLYPFRPMWARFVSHYAGVVPAGWHIAGRSGRLTIGWCSTLHRVLPIQLLTPRSRRVPPHHLLRPRAFLPNVSAREALCGARLTGSARRPMVAIVAFAAAYLFVGLGSQSVLPLMLTLVLGGDHGSCNLFTATRPGVVSVTRRVSGWARTPWRCCS